jgi:hypothetical protein
VICVHGRNVLGHNKQPEMTIIFERTACLPKAQPGYDAVDGWRQLATGTKGTKGVVRTTGDVVRTTGIVGVMRALATRGLLATWAN